LRKKPGYIRISSPLQTVYVGGGDEAF